MVLVFRHRFYKPHALVKEPSAYVPSRAFEGFEGLAEKLRGEPEGRSCDDHGGDGLALVVEDGGGHGVGVFKSLAMVVGYP